MVGVYEWWGCDSSGFSECSPRNDFNPVEENTLGSRKTFSKLPFYKSRISYTFPCICNGDVVLRKPAAHVGWNSNAGWTTYARLEHFSTHASQNLEKYKCDSARLGSALD